MESSKFFDFYINFWFSLNNSSQFVFLNTKGNPIQLNTHLILNDKQNNNIFNLKISYIGELINEFNRGLKNCSSILKANAICKNMFSTNFKRMIYFFQEYVLTCFYTNELLLHFLEKYKHIDHKVYGIFLFSK